MQGVDFKLRFEQLKNAGLPVVEALDEAKEPEAVDDRTQLAHRLWRAEERGCRSRC
jgi:hypothetical protein